MPHGAPREYQLKPGRNNSHRVSNNSNCPVITRHFRIPARRGPQGAPPGIESPSSPLSVAFSALVKGFPRPPNPVKPHLLGGDGSCGRGEAHGGSPMPRPGHATSHEQLAQHARRSITRPSPGPRLWGPLVSCGRGRCSSSQRKCIFVKPRGSMGLVVGVGVCVWGSWQTPNPRRVRLCAVDVYHIAASDDCFGGTGLGRL